MEKVCYFLTRIFSLKKIIPAAALGAAFDAVAALVLGAAAGVLLLALEAADLAAVALALAVEAFFSAGLDVVVVDADAEPTFPAALGAGAGVLELELAAVVLAGAEAGFFFSSFFAAKITTVIRPLT